MKRLIINYHYGEDFESKKLPAIFLRLIKEGIQAKDNSYMLQYIKEKYKIKTSDIIKSLSSNNLHIAKIKNSTIIYFDENIANNLKLNLINDGNLDIKGTNIIDKIVNYIKNNLYMLYQYSLMKGN